MCTAGIGYVAVIIWISIYSWVSELPNHETIYTVAASASVASNSVICVLPIPWIWILEKPKRKKFAATIATGWGIVWVNPLKNIFSQRTSANNVTVLRVFLSIGSYSINSVPVQI
jgi:hypothetical protein